ncbi:MAG: hypothetical protein WDN25_22635 [Acetobacteraceae bacterium]
MAIGTGAVRRAFAERQVTYLKGDWTRQDPQITDYLRANGRDGVPLYVYYPPGGAPLVLPQILTEGRCCANCRGGSSRRCLAVGHHHPMLIVPAPVRPASSPRRLRRSLREA